MNFNHNKHAIYILQMRLKNKQEREKKLEEENKKSNGEKKIVYKIKKVK